jgi:energy-coupling factor transport system permease protein
VRLFEHRERGGAYAALDERSRVLLAAAGVAASLCTFEPRALAPIAAVGLAVIPLARVRWREIRRFAFFAAFVIALLVFFTWLTFEGSPAEKRAHALAQSLRMTSLVAFTAVLPFTIAPDRWGVTFRRLGLPDRLAYAVELAVRFVPTIGARFERTIQAQTARGLELSARAGPVRRLRRLVPIVVPVLLDAIVAGEDVADALDLRAFGTRPRTWCGPRRWGGSEWAAVGLGAALIAFALLA